LPCGPVAVVCTPGTVMHSCTLGSLLGLKSETSAIGTLLCAMQKTAMQTVCLDMLPDMHIQLPHARPFRQQIKGTVSTKSAAVANQSQEDALGRFTTTPALLLHASYNTSAGSGLFKDPR